MNESGVPTTADDPVWTAFAARHHGHPFLELDPLYSLPVSLVEAIAAEAPGFFATADLAFERDLAAADSAGFFWRRPLGTDAETDRALRERQADTGRRIDEMLAEELLRQGAGCEDIEEQRKRSAGFRKNVDDRRDAYAGWLALNPEFRAELRAFRREWESAAREAGTFPRLPTGWLCDPAEKLSLRPGYREAAWAFYVRWSLDTLRTWDWPVPMEPDLNAGQRRDVPLFERAGVFVFLPWHMLRGEPLDLRQVAQHARLGATPDHLLDWTLNRQGGRRDRLGDTRLATVGWLRRYLELALMARHRKSCLGNYGRLDQAFAGVFKREADVIKKQRLELFRVIKADEARARESTA